MVYGRSATVNPGPAPPLRLYPWNGDTNLAIDVDQYDVQIAFLPFRALSCEVRNLIHEVEKLKELGSQPVCPLCV